MTRNKNVQRIQELRRSNAARPIPSGKTYKRNQKHRNKQEA